MLTVNHLFMSVFTYLEFSVSLILILFISVFTERDSDFSVYFLYSGSCFFCVLFFFFNFYFILFTVFVLSGGSVKRYIIYYGL